MAGILTECPVCHDTGFMTVHANTIQPCGDCLTMQGSIERWRLTQACSDADCEGTCENCVEIDNLARLLISTGFYGFLHELVDGRMVTSHE